MLKLCGRVEEKIEERLNTQMFPFKNSLNQIRLSVKSKQT